MTCLCLYKCLFLTVSLGDNNPVVAILFTIYFVVNFVVSVSEPFSFEF